MESIEMSNHIKEALEQARHELTTLHNLTVTNNVESGKTWVTDTASIVKLIDGALSAMHISASVGTQSNTNRWDEYSREIANNQLDISIQKAIRDAAKTLNVAYNAKFINRVEWRTETIDRLLSSVHIKSIDEAIVECKKLENYVFGESESKDIDPLASWYL